MNPTTLFPSLWHRRAASVTLMGSLAALALLGYYVISAGANTPMIVFEALGTVFVGFVLAILARMPLSDRVASWLSFCGFVLSVGGTGIALLADTGFNIHIVLIMILSLFSLLAGLFGPVAWFVTIAVVAPNLLKFFSDPAPHAVSDSIATVAFYILPLTASWLLWHGGPRRNTQTMTGNGDRTYSTLAEQLNQVSNESDIVINTIADGVVALNQRGEIQLINPAAQNILGWSQRDSLGLDYRSIVKFLTPQGAAIAEDQNPILITLHTNKPLERSDLNMQTNAGRAFQARLTVTPVGQVGEGVIVVFRDITAEKAEEREQAEFVSTASHEMRTPVAAIEGYLGLSLNPNTATIDEKARSYLTKAHESAQHLGRLFQDLLDVSKADDGRLRNLPSVVDLVAFCGDVVNGMNTKATEKGLTLTFQPLADTDMTERKLTPVFYADVDADHLREVMNNLVDNAIKYTKSGNVTVNVSGDNKNCSITVHDSGIGIPREDIPHLFQKFYRVDNSDTREIGGTGLGLYLCRRLVEFIGGKIWVESDYGHGSTFTVSLPRLGFDDAQARLKALTEQRERQAANQVGKPADIPAGPEATVIQPLAK